MPETMSRRRGNPDARRASENFAKLMTYVAGLYSAGGSSSVSAQEAYQLALSVSYALGIVDATPQEAEAVLDVVDPIALWRNAVDSLNRQTDEALALWREVVATMPPIHNVALRDTLTSLGELKRRYDVYFAAHEVPCDIDYQVSAPVDPDLMGIDYVASWLTQLLAEAQ